MTAPERIWAWEPKTGLGMWVNNPALNGFHGDAYILHTPPALAASPLVQEIVAEAVNAERDAIQDAVQEAARVPEIAALIEAARNLVCHDGWGTVNYTDNGMWIDAETLRAALRAIAGDRT